MLLILKLMLTVVVVVVYLVLRGTLSSLRCSAQVRPTMFRLPMHPSFGAPWHVDNVFQKTVRGVGALRGGENYRIQLHLSLYLSL